MELISDPIEIMYVLEARIIIYPLPYFWESYIRSEICANFFSILELGECSKRKLFHSFEPKLTCILYRTILTVLVQAGEPEAMPGDY